MKYKAESVRNMDGSRRKFWAVDSRAGQRGRRSLYTSTHVSHLGKAKHTRNTSYNRTDAPAAHSRVLQHVKDKFQNSSREPNKFCSAAGAAAAAAGGPRCHARCVKAHKCCRRTTKHVGVLSGPRSVLSVSCNRREGYGMQLAVCSVMLCHLIASRWRWGSRNILPGIFKVTQGPVNQRGGDPNSRLQTPRIPMG